MNYESILQVLGETGCPFLPLHEELPGCPAAESCGTEYTSPVQFSYLGPCCRHQCRHGGLPKAACRRAHTPARLISTRHCEVGSAGARRGISRVATWVACLERKRIC